MTEKMVSWTTRDETRFLDGLGTYTMSPVLTQTGRIVLLQQYMDSMPNRSNWGDIDPSEVRAHATRRINQLQQIINAKQ